MTLDLRSVDEFAAILETTPRQLARIVKAADSYYEDWVLIDPSKPGKVREIVTVNGELRRLQQRLYKKLLKPRLPPTFYSHGGIKGRHIKSNLGPHLDNTYVLTRDIESFFPSITHRRVHDLFACELGCSADVARICTRLCTYRHHLAQGLITSPILADRMMKRADHRIGTMCEQIKGGQQLVYTRFVDDLTISGRFPIDSGSVPRLVEKIMEECGFKIHPTKGECGSLTNQVKITKITINHGRPDRGRPDIDKDYLADLKRQIAEVGKLQHGGDWNGDYYTSDQILGRIHYVGWINPNRQPELMCQFRAVDWEKVRTEASKRGLMKLQKERVRKSDHERLRASRESGARASIAADRPRALGSEPADVSPSFP